MRPRSPSCSLTIFKGSAHAHISAHSPIAAKPAAGQQQHHHHHQQQQQGSGRFASTFSSLVQPKTQSTDHSAADATAVNVHAIDDNGVLLPFLDRPCEVEELLFETRANHALLHRLCSVFGGSQQQPRKRGVSEAWDELLEVLIGTDRAILDDEDWLTRLEVIIMDRSAELWAQLQRCLGADGLLLDASVHLTAIRYDSWADSSVISDSESVSPGTGPATPISETHVSAAAAEDVHVDVHALHELPPSYYKQPVGQLRRPSMHDEHKEASLGPLSPTSRGGEDAHLLRDQIVSPSSSGHLGEPLADIIEEPAKVANSGKAGRSPSYSGKCAGVRIQATSHHGAARSFGHAHPHAHGPSPLSPCFNEGHDLSSASPLPTRVMSPVGRPQRSFTVSNDATSPSALPTSFTRPRRLSMLVQSGGGDGGSARHHPHHHQHHNKDVKEKGICVGHARSPAAPAAHGHSLVPPSPADDEPRRPRRWAMSFARSFAHLHVGTADGGHCAAAATAGDDGNNDQPTALRRPAVKHRKSHSVSHGEGVSAGDKPETSAQRLGSLPDGRTQYPAVTAAIGRARAVSMANPDLGHGLSPFPEQVTGGTAMREKGCSGSPPIPGLLPDGRTRHPAGSFGSRDLSESIAAFRATMGLSTSPSGGAEKGFEAEDEGNSAAAARPKAVAAASNAPEQSAATSASVAPAASASSSSPASSKKTTPAAVPPVNVVPPRTRDVEPKQGPGGGSGLALGGGFSLAKSGANFKRTDAGPGRASFTGQPVGPGSRSAGRGANVSSDYFDFNFHSSPPVHRRPGGFASLAHVYDSAKRSRGAMSESVGSVFSFHSNAVVSSPGSSVASLDVEGQQPPTKASLYHDGDERNSPMSPVSRVTEWSGREAATRGNFGGASTAAAADSPGQSTPRASMSTRVGFTPTQYPFPPASEWTLGSHTSAGPAAATAGGSRISPRSSFRDAVGVSPSGSGPRHLSPNSHATCFALPSPSLVFPISSDATVSRARELEKRLETAEGAAAISQVSSVCGNEGWSAIKDLMLNTERRELPDEALLEAIGKRLRLVDHEEAHRVGGKEQDEADAILAEEGYEQRWEAFVSLCQALGVGKKEIGLAKTRCGPALELVGSA